MFPFGDPHATRRSSGRFLSRGWRGNFIETADAARGQRVDRAGTDAIDPDFFGAKIVGQIARAGFERGLSHAHDIVMRHNFFAP